MPRRKKRQQRPEDEELALEDTREMWTVGSGERPGSPDPEREPDDPVTDLDDEEDRYEDDDRYEGDDLYAEEGGGYREDDRFLDDAIDEDDTSFEEDEEGWYGEEPVPAAPARRTIGDRLSAISFPDIPDPDPRLLLAAVGVLAASLLVGFGAYRLGEGSGQDLDTARSRGEAAGRQAGAIEGAARGYPAGYRKGREQAFTRAYRRTYRIYYKRAFEQAGLDVPKARDIDVPAP